MSVTSEKELTLLSNKFTKGCIFKRKDRQLHVSLQAVHFKY